MILGIKLSVWAYALALSGLCSTWPLVCKPLACEGGGSCSLPCSLSPLTPGRQPFPLQVLHLVRPARLRPFKIVVPLTHLISIIYCFQLLVTLCSPGFGLSHADRGMDIPCTRNHFSCSTHGPLAYSSWLWPGDQFRNIAITD